MPSDDLPPRAFFPPRSRRPVVWGFPRGYSPNLMGDRCDFCRRSDAWVGRPVPGQSFVAWSCRCSQRGPVAIPD